MFNSKSDTRLYVENNMMLEKIEWQPNDSGKGDALWRTSLSNMAYDNALLRDGILSCFRKFTMINRTKYLYQGARYYNRYREDDVSRDQTILALSSFKVNNDTEKLKDLCEHLPSKLSRRFRSGITMRVWMKAISGKGRFYDYMFQILELIEFIPSVLWNKVIRWLMGWNKEYSQEWYCGFDKNMPFWDKQDDKWVWVTSGFWWVNNGHKLRNTYIKKLEEKPVYRFFDKIVYPEYALHLTAWMIHTSRNSWLKKFLQILAVWSAEKDNYLIRSLMNKNVPQEKIDAYKPVDGYRWSCRFNGTTYAYIQEGDNAKYNTIDKDLITAFKIL